MTEETLNNSLELGKGQTKPVQQQTNDANEEEKESAIILKQGTPAAVANSTQIAIHDMLTKLDLKGFLRPSEVYNVNYRPLLYVISWILTFILPALFEYSDNNTEHVLFYIYLALFCSHFIIIKIILLRINQTTKKQNRYYYPKMITKNMSCTVKYFYIICGEINKLFNVEAKTDDQAKIAPIFGGILLIFGTLSCSILFLLIAFKKKQSLWNLCPIDDLKNNGECLLRKTQLVTSSCWASMSLIIALSLLFEESAECRRKKASEQMLVLSTFLEKRTVGIKHTASKEILVDKLVEKIDKSVKLLIFDELSWKSLAPSHIFYFIVCCAVIFGYHLISYIDYFNASTKLIKCIDIYARCISLYYIMILLYTLHRLIVQYKYPLIVMQELSQPINCTQTMDVFAWWKVRRFYRRYQIHSFSLVFDPVVAGALLIAIVGAAYFIFLSVIVYSNGFEFETNDYLLIIFISYLSIYTLMICEIAASIHKVQLSHHDMLTHELICATLNYQNQIDIEQCERIQNHVLKYSKPMVILGFDLNSTTIGILRGYFVAAVAFLFFNWLEIDV